MPATMLTANAPSFEPRAGVSPWGGLTLPSPNDPSSPVKLASAGHSPGIWAEQAYKSREEEQRRDPLRRKGPETHHLRAECSTAGL